MKTMNTKRILLATVFALALVAALLWLTGPARQKRDQAKTSEPAPKAAAAPQAFADTQPITAPIQSKAVANSSVPAVTTGERPQQLADAPNHMNVPIRFCGKVVDQDNASLAGVKVKVSVREWYYVPPSGLASRHPAMELLTDSEGRFELANASGDDVAIEALEKPGYEAEPKALRGFGYTNSERHTPDPSNPVIFRMWKAETKANLVAGSKRFSIVPDGRTYTIDLLMGAIVESATAEGDLRVSIRRATNAAWGQHYDWSLDVQPVNGGLAEETDGNSAMFRAPEDGYTNNWRLDAKAADASWSYSAGQKRFYLKSRGGRNYARLEIEAYAYYLQDKQGRVNFTWAVNPAGGRLLR